MDRIEGRVVAMTDLAPYHAGRNRLLIALAAAERRFKIGVTVAGMHHPRIILRRGMDGQHPRAVRQSQALLKW